MIETKNDTNMKTLTKEQVKIMIQATLRLTAGEWYSIFPIGDYYEYRKYAMQNN